jgi:hypothetical protein
MEELTEQRSQEVLAEIQNKLLNEFSILEHKDQPLTLSQSDLVEHFSDMAKYVIDEMIKIDNKNEENIYKIQIYISVLLSIFDKHPDIENHQEFFESIYGKMKFEHFVQWLKVLRF